jgi:hypothetical protein
MPSDIVLGEAKRHPIVRFGDFLEAKAEARRDRVESSIARLFSAKRAGGGFTRPNSRMWRATRVFKDEHSRAASERYWQEMTLAHQFYDGIQVACMHGKGIAGWGLAWGIMEAKEHFGPVHPVVDFATNIAAALVVVGAYAVAGWDILLKSWTYGDTQQKAISNYNNAYNKRSLTTMEPS